MSRNTKATIVSTALKLVGSAASDLQAEAELWLDLILQDAAQNYRFPDIQRQHTAAVASGTSTVAYPTDYGFLVKDGTQRGAVGYLLDSNGTRSSVFERTLSDIQIPDTTFSVGDFTSVTLTFGTQGSVTRDVLAMTPEGTVSGG